MIFDLFTPKWKNWDYKIRYKAVLKIRNQKKLQFISKNDTHPIVIHAAIGNIVDINFLVDLIKNVKDKEDREYAIRRICELKDPATNILLDIAKNHISTETRIFAIKHISDDTILKNFAINDANSIIRTVALEKITDQLIIVELLKDSQDENFQLVGLKKLTDKRLIFEILPYLICKDERDKIIKNIPDQNDLVSLLSINLTRETAFDCITDQEILKILAKDNTYLNIRSKVIEKIEDELFLMNIVETDPNNEYRIQALKKINNQSFIANIVLNEINSEVRIQALPLITDMIILRKLRDDSTQSDVKEYYLKVFNQQLNFASIAIDYNHYNYDHRQKAVQKISDASILSNFICNLEKQNQFDSALWIVQCITDKKVISQLIHENISINILLIIFFWNKHSMQDLEYLENKFEKVISDFGFEKFIELIDFGSKNSSNPRLKTIIVSGILRKHKLFFFKCYLDNLLKDAIIQNDNLEQLVLFKKHLEYKPFGMNPIEFWVKLYELSSESKSILKEHFDEKVKEKINDQFCDTYLREIYDIFKNEKGDSNGIALFLIRYIDFSNLRNKIFIEHLDNKIYFQNVKNISSRSDLKGTKYLLYINERKVIVDKTIYKVSSSFLRPREGTMTQYFLDVKIVELTNNGFKIHEKVFNGSRGAFPNIVSQEESVNFIGTKPDANIVNNWIATITKNN
jgi:hypothetical protein